MHPADCKILRYPYVRRKTNKENLWNDLEKVREILSVDKSVLEDEIACNPVGYAIHTWKPDILKYLVSEGAPLTENDWKNIRRISKNNEVLISELESLMG